MFTQKKCKIDYIATIAQPIEAARVQRELRPAAEYFPALTGLRFFLALWVILHHLVSKGMMLDAWTQSLPLVVRTFLQQGHIAVRTFFVLSGFVLAQGYARSRWTRKDLVNYGVARFARVYPVYLVSVVVVAFFIVQFLLSPQFNGGLKLETIAAYLLVLQGWIGNPVAGWNTPAWSLSCEFLFYLCLPALLIWLGPRSRLKLGALMITALVLPIVLRRAGVPSAWKPIMHLGDFLVGIAAARVYGILKEGESVWLRRGPWLYVPAFAMGFVVVVFPAVLMNAIDLGTVLRPLNGLLVLGLALGGGGVVRILSTAVAQYLGQASYSMYILHIPILWWFGNAGPGIFRDSRLLVALVYILGMILVSAACFEYIEKPSNRWIRDRARLLQSFVAK